LASQTPEPRETTDRSQWHGQRRCIEFGFRGSVHGAQCSRTKRKRALFGALLLETQLIAVNDGPSRARVRRSSSPRVARSRGLRMAPCGRRKKPNRPKTSCGRWPRCSASWRTRWRRGRRRWRSASNDPPGIHTHW